ncbi:hypothetical protein [Simplicispira psychrophila]|uniref:hypothetical protein n=1 Tax=Simplicispira psychrophila TaxID=80882 RepID=UPI0012EB84F4|nr:hypothetical protein [Simplicispira psychrophila]
MAQATTLTTSTPTPPSPATAPGFFLLALNGTHAPDAMAVSKAQVSKLVSIESWHLTGRG